MTTPESELDRQLQAFFGSLDTGADFDTRLTARLRVESRTDATERTQQAREQEQVRHRLAVSELQSWRRSTLRVLSLDTLGIVLVLVMALVALWSHFSRDALDTSRQYAPYVTLLLGFLIVALPLLGMWAEQSRRPIRML